MRQLVVQQRVTVDSFAAEENSGLGFVAGEPFSEKSDPALTTEMTGLYGEKVNALRKVAASSTLDDAPAATSPPRP
ncbi:MAG: hypothetical protein J0I34_29535 [Pseudonocardia sp.]|uniref:hypothetical protein n=1 Tax=unclassified Pseudonocardia TaxID=2619320 RepID=UPI00086C4FCB|nr:MULTISPECIES: hypothetical protein [unclassified Pseudonocardia]MBN9112916.1 hypothetical protein [Pseudonocardia sp.]ODU25483.1 MAG: hypothetical protein ABS80_10150 [Pseudonocardia sp. SCN 72-51]ODV05664.1 MAG: hypothetical protein ABT15_16255 [Pseudonocardia sp. SCN 73-27]